MITQASIDAEPYFRALVDYCARTGKKINPPGCYLTGGGPRGAGYYRASVLVVATGETAHVWTPAYAVPFGLPICWRWTNGTRERNRVKRRQARALAIVDHNGDTVGHLLPE